MTGAGLEVFVEAPARLHFGVLDLRGELGRWFGGIGAAAPEATLLVSASRALTVTAHGPDAQRASGFAKRFLDHHHIREGARVCVHRSLPRHAGLGSGTQLALSVARALAELYGLDIDPPALAQAVGRARRSAIGTWIFSGGGLVVEGGRHTGFDNCGPLIARVPFPAEWRCVVAGPGGKGLSGVREEEAFYRLPMPRQEEVERGVGLRDGVVKKVCHQDASVRQAGPRPHGLLAAAGRVAPLLLEKLAHALQGLVHTTGSTQACC